MIAFLIKSTICLIAFYIFYHCFLRDQKILLFNRFYLNISLVLSVLIPLIVIPVRSSFTLGDSIERIDFSIDHISSVSSVAQVSSGQNPLQKIIITCFIIVSLILLARFIINIIKIYIRILKSNKVQYNKTNIVLVNDRILPYSFLKYIFVNKADFLEGRIEQELLKHEEAHCVQFHSIDIIVVELLYIILWFNPALWLMRKEIMLNHEYSADSKVLVTGNSNDYQQLLFNVLIQNNANYLVSNFKYSSIKNRIIMITKDKPSNNAITRKAAGILVFLFIGIALTFSKENILITDNLTLPGEQSVIIPGNEKPELFPVKINKEAYTRWTGTFGEKKINPITRDSIVHYGIDIQAAFGTEVLATAGGKVTKAGWEDKGYGNLIVIDHGDDYQSLYAHLKDVNVKIGDPVTKGQVIGHVGSSGLSTGPHLHFEISLRGDRVNPMTLLK